MNFFYKRPLYAKILLVILILGSLHNIAHFKEIIASTHDAAYKAGMLTGLLLKLVAIVRISMFLINNSNVNAAS